MARDLQSLQKQYNRGDLNMMPRHGMGPGGGRRGRGAPGFDGPKKLDMKVVKRLASYISEYKFRLMLVIVFMLLSTGATIIGAYAVQDIVNGLVYNETHYWFEGSAIEIRFENTVSYLAAILVVIGAIYMIGVFCSYMQSRIMLIVSQNATENIRNDLFNKMQGLPIRYFDRQSVGEIMSRYTNDIDNIDVMLNNTIVSLVSATIEIIGYGVAMLITNYWLAFVVIAFVPLFIKLAGMIAKKSSKYFKSQQAALGALNGYIEESVSGAKVVKVFNHENDCTEEFGLLNNDMREQQFKANFYGGIMGPILGNSTQVTYAVVAGVGGILCLASLAWGDSWLLPNCTVGVIASFAQFARKFSFPITNVSQQTNTIFSALAGAQRVFAVMDETPETPDVDDAVSAKDIRGEVVLDDVTFGYIPEKTVLKHISLYAHPGQKIAFVGSTGAGKTTVTNLINRFYDIQSGSITIDGTDIKQYRLSELRENVAMVLQDTHLFTGTVMENIRYGRPDATDDEVISAAKTASAHSFIMRLEKGYDTLLEGDGANLSQGQRQLLNIARAALSKAPILVLDEATSSVDTRTERHIEHGMDRLMKNRTTFVIAHRLSTVRNSNAIMVLEAGEIIERGTHEQLLELKGRYYELYTGKKELD